MESYNREQYLVALQNLSNDDNLTHITMNQTAFFKDLATCTDISVVSKALNIVNTSEDIPAQIKETVTELHKLKNTTMKGGRQRSNRKSRNLRKRRQSRQRY